VHIVRLHPSPLVDVRRDHRRGTRSGCATCYVSRSTPILGEIARTVVKYGKFMGIPYISWRQVAEYVARRPVQARLF